ncbi:HAD family hydrolase [Arthrobacter cavernae]|uniref:HAD family hydrolase n=1 Tax=Arthrobacter cavernae TaxID=2817681 RepID=A0A939HCB9_9MICC|nr:HAD family hydrolase [Arthrobacter cavernae]MBO1268292.1 HAD family hydrolase [Arthrobacter cavernae]
MSTPNDAAPVMVACDLDRTLIYSAKSVLLRGEDHAAPRMVVSEVYDAAPLSYMTRAAEDLLVELVDRAVFVPVTTRTHAQFSRVQLPGSGTGYAVSTNGAVLMQDGEPDQDWSDHIRRSVQSDSAPLGEVLDRLTGPRAVPEVLRVRTAEDLFVYSMVNRQELSAAYVADLTGWCRERGWTTSLQGRKLYCVPAPVTKEAAVAEVRRRSGAGLLVAAGDSLLDAGLLDLADLAIRPAHGELESIGFLRDNLTVTSAAGVMAGEEILRFAMDAVDGVRPLAPLATRG